MCKQFGVDVLLKLYLLNSATVSAQIKLTAVDSDLVKETLFHALLKCRILFNFRFLVASNN